MSSHSLWSRPKYNVNFLVLSGSFSHCNFYWPLCVPATVSECDNKPTCANIVCLSDKSTGENESWLKDGMSIGYRTKISINIKQQKRMKQYNACDWAGACYVQWGVWFLYQTVVRSLSHLKWTAPGFVWKRTKTTSPAGPWSATQSWMICVTPA